MATITDVQHEQVLRLHRNGEGRNAIAAAVGISTGSVSKICRAAGLTFDRAATEQATKSRKADLAARRADEQLALLVDAARLREEMWQTTTYRELGRFSAAKEEGGTGGASWTEVVAWDQPLPTIADQERLMRARTLALTTERRMADAAGDGDTEQAKSMLGQLFGLLDTEWRSLQAADQ